MNLLVIGCAKLLPRRSDPFQIFPCQGHKIHPLAIHFVVASAINTLSRSLFIGSDTIVVVVATGGGGGGGGGSAYDGGTGVLTFPADHAR